MTQVTIKQILRINKKLLDKLNSTQFDYNLLLDKIKISTTNFSNFSNCSWCKINDSTCAIEYEINNEIYERSVCDKCKINFSSYINKDNWRLDGKY